MPEITADLALADVATIVSDALERAGITAILSGGGAVSIYSANEYQSRDLDFVSAAELETLRPVLESLGFRHAGTPHLSVFDHPLIEWYLEFPPAPLAFGHYQVTPKECAVLRLPFGELRIITSTQCVMDRLAATYAWKDMQSRDQAILVAARQEIDWRRLRVWFEGEGVSDDEFGRFRNAVERAASTSVKGK